MLLRKNEHKNVIKPARLSYFFRLSVMQKIPEDYLESFKASIYFVGQNISIQMRWR